MFQELKKTDNEPTGMLKVIRGYKKGGQLITYNNGTKISEESLPSGVVAEGTFEGARKSKNESGDERTEYAIRTADDTLIVIRGCATLNDAQTGLAAVANGDLVQVEFVGNGKTKSNRSFANFKVRVASKE